MNLLPVNSVLVDLHYVSKIVNVRMLIKQSGPPYWSPGIEDAINGLVTLNNARSSS